MDKQISGTHPRRYEDEHDDEYYERIDLREYVRILWRHRMMLVLGALGCGLAAFLVAWLTQPTYEATARVMVNPSKMLDAGTTTTTAISVASYRELLDNQSVAREIVNELGLANAPFNLSVSSFLERHVTFEAIRDTNVIAISVRLSDAAMAAKIANSFAQQGVELAQRLSEGETVAAREIIKKQVDEARGRLAGAEDALGRFKSEAQIDLVQKDVDALLSERGRLVVLTVDIEGERARLATAEKEFARQDRVRTERSALDASAALPQARPDEAGVALRSESLSPFINPVYEYLDQQISMSRTRLAGLERQRAELVGALNLDAPQVAQLSQLYAKERELARLQMEFDLAQKVYTDVALRYEQARLQVVSHTAQLQVLDTALPPDQPIAPRPFRNTAISLVAGLILSMFGVLLFDVVPTPTQPQTTSTNRL